MGLVRHNRVELLSVAYKATALTIELMPYILETTHKPQVHLLLDSLAICPLSLTTISRYTAMT